MNESLHTKGFAVIRVEWANPSKIRKEFDKTLATFREYRRVPDKYVMGGFSAFGNPSSFHNLFVRKMRMKAMHEVVPLLRNYDGYKLEQLIDRMLLRPSGTSTTAESWHRDEAVTALPEDIIFGGWWNFDDENQYFSCIPGTHKSARGHSGFKPIKSVDNKLKKLITIPPGSILIFHEHIIHEVLSKKYKHDIYRLFLGWRLTKSDKPLFDLTEILKANGVVPLKSGQIPPMYATLHWTNWRSKITDFTSSIIPECKEHKTVLSGKDKGNTYEVVHRHMKSLTDYGLDLYPAYNPLEIELHTPGTQWNIISGRSGKVEHLYLCRPNGFKQKTAVLRKQNK